MDRKQNGQNRKNENLEVDLSHNAIYWKQLLRSDMFIFCFVQTHYVTDKNIIIESEKRARLELTLFSQ